jgi:hypothetical protein
MVYSDFNKKYRLGDFRVLEVDASISNSCSGYNCMENKFEDSMESINGSKDLEIYLFDSQLYKLL